MSAQSSNNNINYDKVTYMQQGFGHEVMQETGPVETFARTLHAFGDSMMEKARYKLGGREITVVLTPREIKISSSEGIRVELTILERIKAYAGTLLKIIARFFSPEIIREYTA